MKLKPIDKVILILFLLSVPLDIACCFIEGNDFSRWFRPSIWFFFIYLIVRFYQNKIRFSLLLFSIIFGIIECFIFHSYGGKFREVIIIFLILKGLGFSMVFLTEIWGKVIFNKKFFIWLFIHSIIAILLWSVIDSERSISALIMTLFGFYTFLMISLNKTQVYIFRQTYLGSTLIAMSVIFASIRINDQITIVELLERITYLIGHVLLFSGILKIELLKNE